MQIRDSTGVIQVTLIKKMLGDELFKEMTETNRESVVMFKGKLQKNDQAPGGMELLGEAHAVLSPAQVPLPMGVVDKVGVDFDTRLNQRHLDLRKPEIGAVFKLKSIMTQALSSKRM